MIEFGNWAAHFTTVGAVLFALGYGFFAPWWRYPIGRNMMALAAVHILIFGLISISILIGPGWAAVRAFVFVASGAILWHRFYLLVKDQILAPSGDRRSGHVERSTEQGDRHEVE
jgi:hypothetical protein